MPRMMRRWELAAVGRENLALREAPVPTAEPGQVLVRVSAVSLNHRDKMVIDTVRGLPLAFPFTPGSDFVGTVERCGAASGRFAVGDRVIPNFTPDWRDGRRPGDARSPAYRTLGGFYPGVLSEYVALSEDWLVRAPATLTDAEASTLPVAGLTAWFALVERAGVRAGDVVLVPNTGGVALFGLQIAKAHGAQVIVLSSVGKLDRACALGADHALDRNRGDLLDAVYAITGDRGADHVLDVVGGDSLARSVQLVAVGGHICQIGALDGFDLSGPAMPLMLKDATIHGIATGHRTALERLVRAVDQTGLKPVIDSRFPLAGLPSALERLDGGPFGKVVVEIA